LTKGDNLIIIVANIDQEKTMEAYATPETLPEATRRWLEKIAPFNTHPMKLNVPRSALIVTDMQTFFLDPASPTFTVGGLAILPGVKRLIAAFREGGLPVIFTRHVHHPDHLDSGIMGWWWEGMCIEGSPESEVHPELAPLPKEKQILKHRYSAFYNTDLETVLRVLKVEDLVITGVMTNMCCESTARDAYFRDYRVFFLADGTGSISEEMHVASLLSLAFGFAHVTTVEEILGEVEKGESREWRAV
jgi:nicotinamidase-related amidase